jgi:hypothetical protein
MSLKMKRLLFAATLLSVGAAAQTDTTVFGVGISQQLSAEKCAGAEVGGIALPPKVGFCIASIRQHNTQESGLELRFAYGELPVWVRGGAIRVTTVTQKVEAVTVLTGGVTSHPMVMEALIAKYGPVQVSTQETAKTRAGVEYDSSIYRWKTSLVEVQYTPVLGRVDEGMLTITTPLGLEANRRSSEALMKRMQGKTAL